MDFIKKNWGLILFLLVCLAVIVYQLIAIVGVRAKREEFVQKRQAALDLLASVRNSGKRLDDENKEKADKVADESKAKWLEFMEHISGKRILPGIDFSVDPDEAAESAKTNPPEPLVDEDGKPVVTDFERFKNNPNRIRFDEWMTGSLVDARNKLVNELTILNESSYTFGDEDEEEDEEDNNKDALDDDTDDTKKNGKVEAEKGSDEKEAVDKAAEDKKKDEKVAKKDKDDDRDDKPKDAYKEAKDKRTKIVKGTNVGDYFMFTEYCENRERGLRNLKEKRGVFRNLILLQKLTEYMHKAEIKELEEIDFPTGLEIMDGDKYFYTPITMTVTAKPECIEAFLNQLSANEEYFFILRDISSLTATVQVNPDEILNFNNGDESGCSLLQKYIDDAGKSTTNSGMADSGMMDDGMGQSRRRRRGGEMSDPGMMDDGMGRGRRGRRGGMDMMGGPGMGMGMEGERPNVNPEDLLPKTRKAYRVFANPEQDTHQNMNGDMDMGIGMQQLPQKVSDNSAEAGTMVTITVNFEYLEYKPAND